jgi:hypothetical protein
MEKKILSAIIHNRSAYEQIHKYINPKDLSVDGDIILHEIKEFYEADSAATSCDVDIISTRIVRAIPNEKHSSSVVRFLLELPAASSVNVVKEVLALQANNIGLELAQKLVKGAAIKEVRPLLDKYNDLIEADSFEDESQELINVSVELLAGTTMAQEGLINLSPSSLNSRLDGGCRRGHHVLIFAPTEMGKTCFVIENTIGFLSQGLRVLYVGNEDPAEDILMRIISNMSSMNKFEIRDNPERAQEEADKHGYSNLIFADLAPGTFHRIESLVDKYLPDVVILDQLSNIDVKGNSQESKTNSLEQAAKLARKMAKSKKVLCISVCQAADSATGKIVLGRGDVHNSNIGIPGQVDLMIGMGANADMEARGLRELSLVKNKIAGNHDHFSVTINPLLSKIV